jgi:predicted HTH domain antitoxin
MDRRAFIQLLGKRQIPRHCGKEELEEDLHYARGE